MATKSKKNKQARARKAKQASKLNRQKTAQEVPKPSKRDTAYVSTPYVKPLRWVMGGLAGLGLVLTLFLSYSAWSKAQLPLCGAQSGCDVVQTSRWSHLIGVPVSMWGGLFYAMVLLTLWYKPMQQPMRWQMLWLFAWAGLTVSIYLTAVSFFIIQSLCVYCLGSLGFSVGIFGLTAAWGLLTGRFSSPQWLPNLGMGLGTALAVALILHVAYNPPWKGVVAKESPRLSGLANHLKKSGALFYGAKWCSACKLQKGMFEGSAHRLPYVECSPSGPRGPRNPQCVIRGVRQYPTWFINNVPYTGVLSPEELARRTGYVLPPER